MKKPTQKQAVELETLKQVARMLIKDYLAARREKLKYDPCSHSRTLSAGIALGYRLSAQNIGWRIQRLRRQIRIRNIGMA